MEATLLLADYAVVQDGKLNLMGAGWTVAGHDVPFAVAFIINVPWHEANRQHRWTLQLFDEDMQPVVDDQGHPVKIEATFEVGRPPGVPEGTPLDVLQAINFGGLPLPGERRWDWRLHVDDEQVAQYRFATRPGKP